jgi:hypothetical protein
MTDLSPRRALASWWGENRRWAQPLGCLALLLPALSLASCAGAVATFLFGAIKVGTSLRKRE